MVAEARRKYPSAKLILWASLECTNFSNAKGGKPKDPDSRTLANHLFRYIDALNPHYILIENVREFEAWGDLDENGKPIKRKNGRLYIQWKQRISDLGYHESSRMMNAADYGAYTARNRLFIAFAKDDLPIIFPNPTHSKKGRVAEGLFQEPLAKWKPVKEVLNLKDKGNCIFDREKPLSRNTLRRIYAGLEKFIAKGEKAFVSKYYSGNPASKNHALDRPLGVITTVPHESLIQIEKAEESNEQWMLKYFDVRPNYVNPERSIDDPAATITTHSRVGLVAAQRESSFLTEYYGNGNSVSVERPLGTITTKDRFGLVNVSGFLYNPQWGGTSRTLDRPCFTLIARMDKAPPYIVISEKGEGFIKIHDDDCEMTVKIKQFMAAHGIIRITLRMIRVHELKRIQGFPDNYILKGNQSHQKKFIGNSVVPSVVSAWIGAMADAV